MIHQFIQEKVRQFRDGRFDQRGWMLSERQMYAVEDFLTHALTELDELEVGSDDWKSLVASLKAEGAREERERLIEKIAWETMDLCTNSQKFKDELLSYLATSKSKAEEVKKPQVHYPPSPCTDPDLKEDCSGCTYLKNDPMGGTHQGCTKQHGHVGCDRNSKNDLRELLDSGND